MPPSTLPPELTTVAPDFAVVHTGGRVERFDGLRPDHDYELGGFAFRTLAATGALVCRFATVNDIHLGELVCGKIDGDETGPLLSSEPGEDPYPEVMSAGAVAEISAIDPAAVIAKGDLTSSGTVAQYDRFLELYQTAFGDRLWHVRGNHDAGGEARFAADATQRIDLAGVTIALLDTSIDGAANGRVTDGQLEWLDELAAASTQPVLVMGHHHCWNPGSISRSPSYFGISPDDSERLIAVVERRREILGYFAGHTHRNRRQHFGSTGDVPWVEVASVKDFPGCWAEYRVYEGGIVQIEHRISSPAALAWTDRTRQMFGGAYPLYSFGTLADRCFAIPGRG